MITYYRYDTKRRILQQQAEYEIGGWVHVENPTKEEIEFLVKELHLDIGHINDGLDQNEVPRLEIEGKALYLFIRFPHIEDITTVTLPFLIIISEKNIVTINLHSPKFLNQALDEKIRFSTRHIEKVLLFILSEITNLYYHYLNRINKEIRQISRRIEKIDNKNIVQFVNFETILNDFRPSLIETDKVLSNISFGKFFTFDKHDRDILEDIHLSNHQIIESCEDTLGTIKNIREAYTTILTNNLNRVIKFFTSITVILTIPTVIASLYGMNVSLPFANHPNAFIAVLLLIMGISGGLLYIFQKNNWF